MEYTIFYCFLYTIEFDCNQIITTIISSNWGHSDADLVQIFYTILYLSYEGSILCHNTIILIYYQYILYVYVKCCLIIETYIHFLQMRFRLLDVIEDLLYK